MNNYPLGLYLPWTNWGLIKKLSLLLIGDRKRIRFYPNESIFNEISIRLPFFFHSHSNNSALLWLTVGSCDRLHEKNALFSSNLVRETSNWDSAMQIQNDVKCHAVPFWLDKYLRMHFPFFVYVKFSPLLMNNLKPKFCELSNLHFQFFFLW